jgi:hypothetical protein
MAQQSGLRSVISRGGRIDVIPVGLGWGAPLVGNFGISIRARRFQFPFRRAETG